MHIRNQRLLMGLQDCIDGLAAGADTAQGKTLVHAANTILGELARREDRATLEAQYREGVAIAQAILRAMSVVDELDMQRMLDALPATLDASQGMQQQFARFDELRAVLIHLIEVAAYPAAKSAALNKAVGSVLKWEADMALLSPLTKQEPPPYAPVGEAALTESVRRQGGAFATARVVKFHSLMGGFAKNTVLFDVEDAADKIHHLVARAAQPIQILDVRALPGLDIAKEFHAVSWLYRQGIRVAEPLWLEDNRPRAQLRYFVSRQAAGRNLGNAIASEPLNEAQARSLATALAAIHNARPDPGDETNRESSIDPAAFAKTQAEAVREYVQSWLEFWRRLDIGPYPHFEAVFKWLLDNIPDDQDDVAVLLHGDYGLHNILFEGDEVSAVLDWEIIHVGDRAQDISWLLTTIGKYISAERFLQLYEEAGGRKVGQFRLKYYEVISQLQFAICNADTQHLYEGLRHAGPHYCILGLGFMHSPVSSFERLIREAEEAKLQDSR